MVWNQFSVSGHGSYVWYQQLCNHLQLFWVSCSKWLAGNYTFWVSVVIYLLCFFLAGFTEHAVFRVTSVLSTIRINRAILQWWILGLTGKSKRTWNLPKETASVYKVFCVTYSQWKAIKKCEESELTSFSTQTPDHCLREANSACAQHTRLVRRDLSPTVNTRLTWWNKFNST